MHLTFRPGRLTDLDPALEMMPPEFTCSPPLRAALPDIWRQWLRQGELMCTVVEDAERSGSRRLVAFGCSVFVTDAFIAEASTTVPPPIAACVTQLCLDGQSPVLVRDAIRRANSSDGLNLLVLTIGWASHLDDEEVRRVKAKLFEAFYFTHGGFLLKSVVQEVYSVAEMERGRAIGAAVLSDYRPFLTDGMPLSDAHPFLIGAGREQVQDGSALSPLFFHSKPRFFFKSGEQDMLLKALLGDSDEEMAADLHVSLSTIHKRWHTVYERVGAVAPDLLPSNQSQQPEHKRGTEKRRHLLSYLRSHLEELRPILPRTS